MPEVFQTAFADRWCGGRKLPGAQLHIYGQLEARLTQSDRVILGGLVEGVWPPAPRIDPWLSRPMRHELGLDLPERRIGLSAHDFAQLLGARGRDPQPFRQGRRRAGGRLALPAPAGSRRGRRALESGEGGRRKICSLRQRDSTSPTEVKPIEQPRAQAAARDAAHEDCRSPRSRTGCAIPTRSTPSHILKLDPLDPVDMPLSAADRGSAIHDALGEFTKEYANALPDDPAGVLRGIGEKYFAPLMERPEARALWWPRFQRIARWFAEWEAARRGDIAAIDAEIRGEITIPLDNASAPSRSPRAPTASNAAATAATPSSTTRPGSRRPASRCGWDCRRS